MKQPQSFSTGDPSYFVVASTSGSVSPTALTLSKAPARIRFAGIRFMLHFFFGVFSDEELGLLSGLVSPFAPESLPAFLAASALLPASSAFCCWDEPEPCLG